MGQRIGVVCICVNFLNLCLIIELMIALNTSIARKDLLLMWGFCIMFLWTIL